MHEMQIQYWPIDKLLPYERNPRKNDHAVAKVAQAIKEFGFRVPVVAKSDGPLVDGHLRLKAAQHLGLAEVQVILADDMTDAQVRAFRISVNKMAELGQWDYDLLKIEVAELQEIDYDITLTGLSDAQLRKVSIDPVEVPERQATVKSGDLDDFAPSDEDREQMAGKRFVTSYSGGMDSSACALWVRHFFPQAPLDLVFVDLGADFIGFIDHLRAFAAAVRGCSRRTAARYFSALRHCGYPIVWQGSCRDGSWCREEFAR